MQPLTDIYSPRQQQPGWNYAQADILLTKAREHFSTSPAIYAALEMRLAIEQLLFSIIVVTLEGVDAETYRKCKNKDGLFKTLGEVSDNYTLRCRFISMLSNYVPGMPEIAEWDIRKLKRYYTDLSDFCHSQLVIENFADNPKEWKKKMLFLREVKDHLYERMSKNTVIVNFSDWSPEVQSIWDNFVSRKITEEQVDEKLSAMKADLATMKRVQ